MTQQDLQASIIKISCKLLQGDADPGAYFRVEEQMWSVGQLSEESGTGGVDSWGTYTEAEEKISNKWGRRGPSGE